MVRRGALPALLMIVQLLSAGRLLAECPAADEVKAFLRSQPLEQASRSILFGGEVPFDLYEEAIEQPNMPIPRREGSRIQGAMLSELPTETLWKALNDDHHHDDDGFVAVRSSEVIAGQPGHSDRELFQYYMKAGFGRWWVVRLTMNEGLFAASGKDLWELRWEDLMDSYRDKAPPVRIGASVRGIEGSFGSWLLMRVAERCTLVEYFAEGDPGGFAASIQWMGMTKTMRSTMLGMVSIVNEHLGKPHPRGLFVRPDGGSLDTSVP
jgi:hypothetical protein